MENILQKIDWNKNRLIPVIAQEYQTNEILMLAYMNQEALKLTLETNIAHYYSRSKKRIWKKGETSGNIQQIKEILIDCDNDTLLIKIDQIGSSACHTGRRSCFFTNLITNQTLHDIDKEAIKQYSIIDTLYHVINERKKQDPKKSYVASLMNKGENTILKKIVEESGEFCFAIKDSDEKEIIYEGADLIFHLLVALGYKDINPDLIKQELKRRFGLSGIEEKKNRA